jgi:PIN domain nuclease of toxin-antitoxin system
VSALLLDTHVWLWYAEGVADRLRPAAVRKLEEARRDEGLVISAISVWEIGMHAARGRIQLTVPLRDWVERALAVPGIRLAPLDAAVAAESTLLPGEPQGDPADRFLIATARTHGVALATRDDGILAYAKQGFLRAVRV